MKIFPNAKVVLTLRDPLKWYVSMKQTILKIREFRTGPIGMFIKLVGLQRVLEQADIIRNQAKEGVNDKGKYAIDEEGNNIIGH